MSEEKDLSGQESQARRIRPKTLEREMRESFIDYSMSVIVQRALPDVRDGLKPVHRRILYAMSELGLGPGRPYKKCATVVGDVLGKYHPHGDSAVYDSLVRMAQDFSLRYPLIDGQGNFGSIDGDAAAAYRYTEARLSRIAPELLNDIEKETVEFAPNFDGSRNEPTVLPTCIPNLLVNGSSGIAVGMSTNVPPHNLAEVVDGALALIEDPELPQARLEDIVTGPDFPTGAFICGRSGIREAYRTGRGRITQRARATIEEDRRGKVRIVVMEIPFMVNKSRLIEEIAQGVRDGRLPDISDLRDESDRRGMSIVIELKRSAVPLVALNRLYRHTQMQRTFGAIMLALVDGEPRILPLRRILGHFIEHRHDVVVRRSEFELARALARQHVLEGLVIAVDNIDRVIRIIRGSPDSGTASSQLIEAFDLSEKQAKAILEMRLSRLTGLEIEKLQTELAQIRETARELRELLASRERRMEVVADELRIVRDKYGDERRTEITGPIGHFDVEDLIVDEEAVITISHEGYVKRLSPENYRAQLRGGKGLRGMDVKGGDWVEHIFIARTHDYLLVFTRDGQCHWLKVWQIPEGSRYAKGTAIVNLLDLEPGSRIASVLPVRDFDGGEYVFFCTRKGIVKKSQLSAYRHVQKGGIIAIRIREDDELLEARLTSGSDEILLASSAGAAIRFRESDVRPLLRASMGVQGMNLRKDDEVVDMVVLRDDTTVLAVSEKGLGKRTSIDEYRLQQRGGTGVINLKVSERTGRVVAARAVREGEHLMIMTKNGVVNRQLASAISLIGRATQGVKLVSLGKRDSVVDVALVDDGGEADEKA